MLNWLIETMFYITVTIILLNEIRVHCIEFLNILNKIIRNMALDTGQPNRSYKLILCFNDLH